jgi:hypothetical protein
MAEASGRPLLTKRKRGSKVVSALKARESLGASLFSKGT